MNKTYKTVYNAVSGTWAAVSELAKSQGKNTTRAAAALVLLAVSPAWGAQNTGTTTSGGNTVPAGADYKSCYFDDNSKNVVCGDATTTAADIVGGNKPGKSVAIGLSAKTAGESTVAVGDTAQASKLYAIAIGNKAEASGEKSVVIGSNETATNIAKATGRQSVAIGWTAQATGFTQAVAIGPDAQALGGQSTSIGNNTRAKGNSSIAIGSDDWDLAKAQVDADYQRLTGTAMSAGYQSTEAAEAAIAVGVKAQATGALSTAFGPGAQATEVGATAVGVGAEADKEKAVAIGAGSRTSTVATPVTSATVNGVTYSGFAGATKITDGSQVSIGTAGYERQIKHVAPGEISATSTDAINGSQLYHVAAQAANPLKFDGDSGTTVERPLGTTLNVKGGATGTLTDNNIGVVADKASNTLRLKLAQNVDLGNAGSLKTGNTTVNNSGLTIANGPSVTNTGIDAGNKPITNVASGGNIDSNAANIGDVKRITNQLSTNIQAAKTEVVAGDNIQVTHSLGNNNQSVYTVKTVADPTFTSVTAGGNQLDGTAINVNGNTVTNVNNAINQTAAQAFNPLKFDGDSGTTVERKLGTTLNIKGGATGTLTDNNIGVVADNASNTLRLKLAQNVDLGNAGSLKTGNTTVNNSGLTINNGPSVTNNGIDAGNKQITHVADGTNPNDAVNVRQLQAAVAGSTANQNQINQLGQRIGKLEDNSNAGIAGGIAQSSIPQVTRTGASGIGIGTGYYGGQSAIAVGASAISDGGNWIVKGSFSVNSQGRAGVGAGALYQW